MKSFINRLSCGISTVTIRGALLLLILVVAAACGEATPTTAPAAQATNTTMTMPADGTMTMPMDEPTPAEGADPTATTSSGGASSGGGTTVDATLREWALDVSVAEVPAGKVTFNVSNAGQFAHNFAVRLDGGDQLEQTPNFTSGDGVQTVELELAAGTYILYCALPGHEQQGQRAVLTVK